jgi:hypothetical protein
MFSAEKLPSPADILLYMAFKELSSSLEILSMDKASFIMRTPAEYGIPYSAIFDMKPALYRFMA